MAIHMTQEKAQSTTEIKVVFQEKQDPYYFNVPDVQTGKEYLSCRAMVQGALIATGNFTWDDTTKILDIELIETVQVKQRYRYSQAHRYAPHSNKLSF